MQKVRSGFLSLAQAAYKTTISNVPSRYYALSLMYYI